MRHQLEQDNSDDVVDGILQEIKVKSPPAPRDDGDADFNSFLSQSISSAGAFVASGRRSGACTQLWCCAVCEGDVVAGVTSSKSEFSRFDAQAKALRKAAEEAQASLFLC
jgi:hypothetical protein